MNMNKLLCVLIRVVSLALALISAAAFAGTITYYHNDLLGSPVVATNASGQVIWRESYRPYGERLTNDPNAATNKMWFTSRRQDAETGLVYMGARYYDPVAGRFVSTDPTAFDDRDIHSFNRYSYANNNPYRFRDPDGHMATPAITVVGGVLLIGSAVYLASGPQTRAAMQRALIQAGENVRANLEWATGRVGSLIFNEGEKEGSNAVGNITPRPDIAPQSGGRSGEKVKDLKGPPNSAIPGQGDHVYITDDKGNVIADVTPDRSKEVVPGQGFGEKRPPTQQELDAWGKIKGDQ